MMTVRGISKGQLCRLLVAASAFSVATALVAPAAYAQEATRSFNVPAQPMGRAVLELGRQAGISISAPREATRGRTSQPVSGVMSTRQALGQMLEGSGLSFEFVNGSAVRIYNNNMGPPGAGEAVAGSAAADSESANEEIVVTGTNIRGGNPVAPVRSYDRRVIDQSGYTTTGEFIQSLPLNFKGGSTGTGGGNSEDGIFIGGANNLENATSANLRGLGSGATLVLLNGRRIAPSAYGTGVDLSLFPLQAIQRIDVLPDGATAIYGADAVAGVVNVILRRDYQGAESYLSVGGTRGRTEVHASQTGGLSWGSGGILGTVNYDYASNLDANSRTLTRGVADDSDLLPRRSAFSGLISAHQDITSRLTVSTDVLYRTSEEDRRIRFSPTDRQQIYHTNSEFSSFHAGLDWEFLDHWHLTIDGDASRVNSRIRAFFSPAQNGYTNNAPYLRNRFNERSIEGKIDGSLFSLPGGPVRLAVGATHRSEDFSSLIRFTGVDRPTQRDVDAVYGELLVPLFGSGNAQPLLRRLELSLAGRIDSYSDFGTTTNPRVGILWSPVSRVTLRGSYATSFRAPSSLQIIGNRTTTMVIRPNYALPTGGTGKVLVVPNQEPLSAEEAQSFNLDLSYEPIDNLALRVSAYRIRFNNAIVSAPFNQDILVRPDVYGDLVTTYSDDASIISYVNSLRARGYLLLDASGGGGNLAGIRYQIPGLNINAARVVTQGLDVSLSYAFDLGGGRAYLTGDASIIDKLHTGFCAGCASTDLVDTTGNPVSFRGRVTAGWGNRSVQVNAALNYADDYMNTIPVVHQPIDAFTTVDFNIRYMPSFVPGTTVGLSATNIFNAMPPFVQSTSTPGLNYDAANASAVGRVINVYIRKTW